MTMTQEYIGRLRELAERANPQLIAGIDGSVIVGCSGYHEEDGEYEYFKFAEFCTPEDAQYYLSAGETLPALLAELIKLRDALTKIHIAADTTRIFLSLHGGELDRDDIIEQLSGLVTTILDVTTAMEESEE